MIGGDRMSRFHHGYSPIYARYIRPLVGRPVILVEVGILKGTGLATWSDLFPEGRVIGLDIDLGHIQANMPILTALGAFKNRNILLHEFDQFADNRALLGTILGDTKIDVVIDDGFHSDEAILTTLKSILPYLARSFVYFIEDNVTVASAIAVAYPQFSVASFGEITVLRERQ